MLKVAAVIPAHNEEATIADALADIARQTYPVDPIVVVNDCSTDRTAEVLAKLARTMPQLVVLTNDLPRLRAGAINCGLAYLRANPVDLVMAADADSRFDPGLIEAAVDCFARYPALGGVCSTSGVVTLERCGGSLISRMESWFLWRLQRLDGAGFDATRTATWRNVQILHGLCTVFRLQAVLGVQGYSPGHMLEDYDLTLRLKRDGWRTMYCAEMKAWTRVPATFEGFFRQRLRWMRGGMDILLQYGINRFTCGEVVNHLLFLLLFLGVLSYAAVSLLSGGWGWRLSTHPLPWLLAALNLSCSVYKLRFLDRADLVDLLMKLLILPELAMASALSVLQLAAYYLSWFKRPQRW